MRSLFLIITTFLLGILPAVAQGGLARSIRTQSFLTDLAQPVLIRSAKDGSRRLFVVLQRGRIMSVAPGSSTPSLFMDISSKVSQATGYSERGLLGLTFDPQFSTNGYFFVNYTRTSDGATVIARYRTTTSANVAGDPNSERVLMTIAQPYANHNGGMVEFGPDGNLYIGMGDGGSANDPLGNAQNINTHLGKMLRITPDVSGVDANPPYTSPASNPYVGVDGLDEIFAIGLRNPWRWSFDRGGTNQLWVADVGQNVIEEVNIVTR
ncbi:MAG: PQQ-dependent sugar dehydrogenase, partial [Acidobacteriota bacterium]